MATDASSDSSLQEKLQGQVASSVKEALEKSTTILSNLHHLSTYLEVISKIAGSVDRVKDAHDQIQSIRADCASLLQIMYLGEIGLQSLLDMLKTNGGIGGLIPHIFSDPLTAPTSVALPTHSDHNDHTSLFDDSVLGKHPSDHTSNEDGPTPKKSVVTVFACNICNHKFAVNSSPNSTHPTRCKNCREEIVQSDSPVPTDHAPFPPTPTPSATPTSIVSSNTNKQLKPKSTRRGKFNALKCKLCGVSFFYRRCLLRHLRETHGQLIDVSGNNSYEQFIEKASKEDDSPYKGVVDNSIDKGVVNVPSLVNDSTYNQVEGVSAGTPSLHITTVNSSGMDYSISDSINFDETSLTQGGAGDADIDPPELPPSLVPDDLQLGQSHSAPTGGTLGQATPDPMSLSNSTSVTDSIIEAVQNQAILEQASALLNSTSVDTPAHVVTTDTNSLLVQIQPQDPLTGTNATPTANDKPSNSGKTGEDSTSSNFREFRCTICNKAFDRPYRLTRHLEIHDPNRPRIPCNYCSKTFTRKDSLESHIKTVHASVYPYTCNHEGCNRSFATRSMYLSHLKVHGENKPYHCQECPESFTLLNELKDHFKKEHPENEALRCSECFKVCLSQEELEEHRLRDHRFECESCGKVFARLAYLQTHVRVHNGESKFNCRFCSEGFNSAYSYRQHMKSHPEYRRTINVFPCHPCGKTFQEPKDLIAHYETPEHKEKAANIEGAVGQSTATSLMEGDLSVMGELMTDQIINSIVSTHAGFDELHAPSSQN